VRGRAPRLARRDHGIRPLSFACRAEAFEFLKPVLDQVQPGHLKRFDFAAAGDQESAAVGGNVVMPDPAHMLGGKCEYFMRFPSFDAWLQRNNL